MSDTNTASTYGIFQRLLDFEEREERPNYTQIQFAMWEAINNKNGLFTDEQLAAASRELRHRMERNYNLPTLDQ